MSGDPAMEKKLVLVGRISAAVAIVLAMITARPLLGNFDQAFQFIQEFTGFFTPGHHRHLPARPVLEAGDRGRRARRGGRRRCCCSLARCGGSLPRLPVHEPDAGRVPRRPGAGGDRVAGSGRRRPRPTASRRRARRSATSAGFNISGARRDPDPDRALRHLVVSGWRARSSRSTGARPTGAPSGSRRTARSRRSERDGRGVTSVAPGGFAAEAAAIRGRFGDLPMLLRGDGRARIAAGRVAPMCRCPAGIDETRRGAGLDRRPDRDRARRRDARRPADVMRGEEVQLLGAVAAGLAPADALLCQPGTHCKWAEMADGRLAGFTTAMTGELFALLEGAQPARGRSSAATVAAGRGLSRGRRGGGRRDLLAPAVRNPRRLPARRGATTRRPPPMPAAC